LVLLDNGSGASVGVSPSLPLADEYYFRALVIRTNPDGAAGQFNLPRVRARGAYVAAEDDRQLAEELGFLPAHARRFKQWIADRS
jgi:hypothetical protein